MTQQSHYWVYIKRIINHSIIKTHAQVSSLWPVTIAKIWNQPKCPSMIDWTRKMWHIYTMEYYTAIKNNEFVSFVGTWMNLETITLSKLTQEQKIKQDMFSLTGRCWTMRIHGHREGSIKHWGLLRGARKGTVGGRELGRDNMGINARYTVATVLQPGRQEWNSISKK